MVRDTAHAKASNNTNFLGWVSWVIFLVVGGLLLTVMAGFNISLVVVSLTTHDPYAYFEMDQAFVAYAVLPFWTTILVAGCALLALSGLSIWRRTR